MAQFLLSCQAKKKHSFSGEVTCPVAPLWRHPKWWESGGKNVHRMIVASLKPLIHQTPHRPILFLGWCKRNIILHLYQYFGFLWRYIHIISQNPGNISLYLQSESSKIPSIIPPLFKGAEIHSLCGYNAATVIFKLLTASTSLLPITILVTFMMRI